MKAQLPNSIEVKSSNAFCWQSWKKKRSHTQIEGKKIKSDKEFRTLKSISSVEIQIMLCRVVSNPRPGMQYTSFLWVVFCCFFWGGRGRLLILPQWQQYYWQRQLLVQHCIGYSSGAAHLTAAHIYCLLETSMLAKNSFRQKYMLAIMRSKISQQLI